MSGILKAGDSTVIQLKRSDVVVCVYIKTCERKDISKDLVKTLLIRGIPSYWPQDIIHEIFTEKVVAIHKKPGLQGYKVTFKEKSAVDRVLKMPYDKVRTCKASRQNSNDIYEQYALPSKDPHKMKSEVDSFLEGYFEKLMQEKKEVEEGEGKDKDGWVTVSKKNKTKQTVSGNGGNRRRNRLKKKNAEKELLKFYRFQEKETKKENALIEKLDEEKTAHLKTLKTRRFRPY